MMTLQNRKEAIHIAKKWVGTPYEKYGRTPGKGLDCIGFVACLGRALGYEIPEPILDGGKPYYKAGTPDPMLYKKYAELWGHSSKSEPQLGDILLVNPQNLTWWGTVPDAIIHNVLYTGKTVIHCGTDGVVEEKFTNEWDLAIRGIFSFRGYSHE